MQNSEKYPIPTKQIGNPRKINTQNQDSNAISKIPTLELGTSRNINTQKNTYSNRILLKLKQTQMLKSTTFSASVISRGESD
jgi:hypothetical protein